MIPVYKTSLYESHRACKAKIINYADFLLPEQYPTGIIAEHNAVRKAAGLFDVSHMGEIFFSGKDALKNLNFLLANDFTSMVDGQVRYSVMCNREGGSIDDMIIYRFDEENYLAVVNAANTIKDHGWMVAHSFGDVSVDNVSDSIAQIALQGPLAKDILLKLVPESDLPAKYYTFRKDVLVGGMKCLISQTGYTGEAGYELYMSNEDAPDIWDILLAAGKDKGLKPCGLGARDTLRLEAGMPLYSHELSEIISPLECGLDFSVQLSKDDFIGKEALLRSPVPDSKRIGLRVTGRGIARERQRVFFDNKHIGMTTSGTHAPFLKIPIAMANVLTDSVEIGMTVEIDIRGRRTTAEVIPLPFYKRQKQV